ncbi:MAG: DPP IV N-terminal domain-containing protein [Verrucomicrobia bacterium]|nr:DPP IV N-terminal domain-containing protein [Verrucomicrobiota bacterium]
MTLRFSAALLGLAVWFCLLHAVRADEPKPGENFLRDFAETRGFLLGRPVKAKLTPDGGAVIFLRAHSARDAAQELYEFDVASRRTRRLLSPDAARQGAAETALTPEEKARRERQRVSAGGFTAFELSQDGARVLLSLGGKLYVLTRATGAVVELHTSDGAILDPQWSPDGRSVAYVRDVDLYVYDLAANQERAVTTGGSEERTHGLAEFVAQEEMGRFSGYWWSPDARWLVYQENDASQVESWFVADPAKPEQKPLRSYYPRPGKNNVQVRVGVIAANGGETMWLDWNRARYPYLTHVDWSEHGPLTITVESREQKDLALLEVDPKTGATKSLLSEHNDAWLNLDQDVPKWLPEKDGGGFLWTSERTGDWQLERRARDGRLQAVLVPPAAGYRGLVDALDGEVYFRADTDPTQTQLWRVALAGGGNDATPLTSEPGLHNAELGRGRGAWVHTVQTRGAMLRTFVRRWEDSSLVGELPSIAEEPPFVPKAEFGKVGVGEGFHTVIVRPRDFDPGKRYPVIVDVYGGPHHQQVVAAMRPYLLDQWLADQGFVVVAADGRGTPGRGRDWERAIAGKFGDVPLEDQVAALRALGAKFSELDLDRVGITGWSFGGYMSALAALRRPEVFKAAVAGAPVADWLDYDTHYTERYLGLPQSNAESYRASSLLTYAANLRVPLLLIHGTADDNVYFRHTLRLADALFRAGRSFDLLPLSGLTHMMPDPIVRERESERLVRHFRENLGTPQNRAR